MEQLTLFTEQLTLREYPVKWLTASAIYIILRIDKNHTCTIDPPPVFAIQNGFYITNEEGVNHDNIFLKIVMAV
jgi:hypothetical protein